MGEREDCTRWHCGRNRRSRRSAKTIVFFWECREPGVLLAEREFGGGRGHRRLVSEAGRTEGVASIMLHLAHGEGRSASNSD